VANNGEVWSPAKIVHSFQEASVCVKVNMSDSLRYTIVYIQQGCAITPVLFNL